MLMFACISMMAQAPIKVKGVVMDTAGASVIAASVVEQGNTSNGVVTDLDGKFELTVPAGAQLVVSSIGYATQVVEVGNQAELTIILEEDSQLLEETVVVGYGTQKKKLVTGSTVQVKGDDLMKLNTTNALGAMQASTPGMQITSASGQPGEGFKVSIRGMGTIGSYQPLYVIDGVAGGDINALNPSDIESIDVLKDAASCAIYGARGANGVVLVTTRQGKAGKYTVTYDGFYGVQNVQKMPELLDAKQWMNVMNMVSVNNGGSPIDWAGTLDADLYNSIMDGSFKGTNWLDAIRTKNAPYQNHAVNIVGGSDRTKMSMGISNTDQEGIFGYPVQSKYNRTTVRINSDHVILRKGDLDVITFGENMTYTYSTKSGIGIGDFYWNDIANALRATPLVPLKDADGNYTDYDDIEKTGLWNFNSYIGNPVLMMTKSSRANNQSQGHALNLSANLRIQPIKGLVFRSQFNYKLSAGTYRSYDMTFKANSHDYNATDGVSQSAYAGWDWSWENTVNYKFNIAEKNHFDVLAGTTLEHSGFGENVSASNTGGKWKDDPTYAYVDNMTNETLTRNNVGGSTWGDYGMASFFGRINYDYDEKYMFSAILRADGSSNFAPGKRWGIFPSVAAGWVVSSEPWMEGTKGVLDYLKVRASWGQNGNCSVDNFQYLATVSVGALDGGYSFGNGLLDKWQTGSYADKLANPDITWETSEQIDLGIDARFFSNRLNVTFDWYQKNTKDWLVNAPVMGHFGMNAPYINGGDVRNTGVELALNWSDAIGKDFSYSVGVSGSYNKNIVTRLANEEGIIHGPGSIVQGNAELYRAQVGYPIGYFWTYKTAGVFQNQAEIDEWVAAGNPVLASPAQPGDLKIVDIHKDGTLDDKDKTMTGDPNPDFILGLNFSVYYKGFDFAMSGYGNFGQQVFRTYRRYTDSQWDNYTTEVFDYWHGEGTSNKYPRLVPGATYNFMNNTDIFIEDADFFRIQSISLGYDFNKLWKNSPFGQLRLYVQANNPFVITNYKGLDPEVGSSAGYDEWAKGIDLGYYPQARTMIIGVNLKF